jgi:hypothetical protein
LFLIAEAAAAAAAETSFMSFNNWCLVSGLQVWYTLDFKKSHNKKLNGVNSGDLVGHVNGPPCPIHCH